MAPYGYLLYLAGAYRTATISRTHEFKLAPVCGHSHSLRRLIFEISTMHMTRTTPTRPRPMFVSMVESHRSHSHQDGWVHPLAGNKNDADASKVRACRHPEQHDCNRQTKCKNSKITETSRSYFEAATIIIILHTSHARSIKGEKVIQTNMMP